MSLENVETMRRTYELWNRFSTEVLALGRIHDQSKALEAAGLPA